VACRSLPVSVGRLMGEAVLACTVTMLAAPASPRDLGAIAFVGDSITQGGPTPSYRYPLWKRLVDADLVHGRDYTFVGSQTGFYAGGRTAVTADHRGQAFPNVHEGHWGWRAAWIAGATPLPKGRHDTKNVGAGIAATWTGRASTFITADSGTVAYSGRVTIPDTVVLMVGINDLADGATAGQVADHIATIVRAYQSANPSVHVHVCSTLPVSAKHPKAAMINPRVADLATILQRAVGRWSRKGARVAFIDARPGFDPTHMTYDATHPDETGEAVVADAIAAGLGISRRQAGEPDARPGE